MLGSSYPGTSCPGGADVYSALNLLPKSPHRVYARNGPNPLVTPLGNYHWFDGDGMTHALRISSKGLTYSNRYVRTTRLAQEEKAGWQLFPKVPSFKPRRPLAVPALVMNA